MPRHHANRGVVAESAMEIVHLGYRARGHYCQRNPTPYKVIGAAPTRSVPGALRVVPERDGPPDWIVVAESTAFLMDVKSSTGDRWSYSDLPQHQAQAFDRWETQGSSFRAGVLLSLHHHTALAWLPWTWLGPRWWRWWAQPERATPGTASLSVAELAGFRCSWDWMPMALRLAGG